MNSIAGRLSVVAVTLAGLLVIAGCGTKEHVEETETTTYVPAAAPEVVVQPAPVVGTNTLPPQPVTTWPYPFQYPIPKLVPTVFLGSFSCSLLLPVFRPSLHLL